MTVAYEELSPGCGMDISPYGIRLAFERLGVWNQAENKGKVKLVVHAYDLHLVQYFMYELYGHVWFDFVTVEPHDANEWYVEYYGRRVGSLGI